MIEGSFTEHSARSALSLSYIDADHAEHLPRMTFVTLSTTRPASLASKSSSIFSTSPQPLRTTDMAPLSPTFTAADDQWIFVDDLESDVAEDSNKHEALEQHQFPHPSTDSDRISTILSTLRDIPTPTLARCNPSYCLNNTTDMHFVETLCGHVFHRGCIARATSSAATCASSASSSCARARECILRHR